MKRELQILVLFILTFPLHSIPTYSQSIEQLDQKYGFRDIKFEQDINTLQNMILIGESNNEQYYTRTTDILRIENYDLQHITYGFYKGRLFTVILEAKGPENSRGLMAALLRAYGNGQVNRIEKYRDWIGDRVMIRYTPTVGINGEISSTATYLSKEYMTSKNRSLGDTGL
jgi:hypothetical protein